MQDVKRHEGSSIVYKLSKIHPIKIKVKRRKIMREFEGQFEMNGNKNLHINDVPPYKDYDLEAQMLILVRKPRKNSLLVLKSTS